ncbi:hypothetical protein HZC35_02135 [Candidatus Saganbacteria bacterium]|nr:hypothetical protein [Candidatus Saganbacteria bacterium]
MITKISKTFKFPEARVGTTGRSTTFGRNLDYFRKLKVGFSKKFTEALKDPRHTLTRFLSALDLETISRETDLDGIKTDRWLTGLSQVFDGLCREYDLTRTQRVPGGHREVAGFKIVHEELNPPIRGRRFVLDYEEPQLVDMPELVLPLYTPPPITAEVVADQLFHAQELFLDHRLPEARLEVEAALDYMREGDLKPLDRLETLEVAAVIYFGIEKQAEGLELSNEMFSLFSDPSINRFSLPRFFEAMIAIWWKTGNRPLAYKAIDQSFDIAAEMITILEKGDPGLSFLKDFAPIPRQLDTIRIVLKDEAGAEAVRIKNRLARLFTRMEALGWSGRTSA